MVLCILMAALAVGTAQASTVVRINNLGPIQPGDTVTVQVTLDSVTSGLDIVGFDFLIAWEPTALRLIEAQEGQLLTDCGWEYFDARSSTMTEWNGLPANIPLVRAVSVADINNGDIHPSCNATAPGELVILVFEASSHPMNYGMQPPIRFLWTDCGDNSMALDDGSLIVSDQVFDDGWDWSMDDDFPTWFGAPDVCLTGGPDTLDPIREIDFYNGHVEFADGDTDGVADATVYLVGENYSWLGWPVSAQLSVHNVAPLFEAGGFDLLMQYDPAGLVFSSASQGSLLNGCDWEYFNYRASVDSGLIRLVALADINNGDIHPSCWLNQDGTLAWMHFQVVNSPSNIGRELPLKFVWMDCGDNVLSNPAGDSLYLSSDVYDSYGFVITAEDTMPTINGAPQGCLTSGSVRRAVDYFSGMFTVANQNPGVSDRGDVNLNGLPYEITDFVLFSNYFFYGLIVFNVNIEAQVAATDVNADGLTLTFNDLAYLYRVIVGDAEPIWTKSGTAGDTAYVIQDTTVNSLSVAYDGSVTLLFLTFSGTIEPGFYDSSGLDVQWTSEGGNTRMIMSPGFQTGVGEKLINTGFLMNYTGDGQLVGAAAAYDGLTGVPALVQIGQGVPCCVDRGNVDHDPLGVLDISDLVFLVSHMFGLGPPPPCPGEADINDNGLVEIGDLVWLVDYMFNAGPPPVPCP
ncbi:MAG: hypothetical protein KAW46_10140 [candidate division Zixibacteria bacterium]|nr:hypothetical protein [candidate division Zixibacteria bacterium]